MMKMRNPCGRRTAVALALAGLAGLAGCSGSDDDASAPPAPTAAVPDSASQSSAGLVAYLKALAAADAETLEPVDLGTFAPVQPEDSEPEVVS